MMYKQQHGHVNVPQFYTVPQKEGPPVTLGQWVQTLRVKFKTGKISAERISKLNELGFVWVIRKNVGWNERYRELIEYREEHGDVNVPQHYKLNKSLGPWVDKQRQKYRKGVMPKDQEEKLNAVGFEWVRGKTPNRDYSKSSAKKRKRTADNDGSSDQESNNEQFEREDEAAEYHDANALPFEDAPYQPLYYQAEQQYQRYPP